MAEGVESSSVPPLVSTMKFEEQVEQVEQVEVVVSALRALE